MEKRNFDKLLKAQAIQNNWSISFFAGTSAINWKYLCAGNCAIN